MFFFFSFLSLYSINIRPAWSIFIFFSDYWTFSSTLQPRDCANCNAHHADGAITSSQRQSTYATLWVPIRLPNGIISWHVACQAWYYNWVQLNSAHYSYICCLSLSIFIMVGLKGRRLLLDAAAVVLMVMVMVMMSAPGMARPNIHHLKQENIWWWFHCTLFPSLSFTKINEDLHTSLKNNNNDNRNIGKFL